MRILIVEEDVQLAEALKASLRPGGYQIEAVTDADSGSMHARSGIYDLLILDAAMHSPNGYELTQQIRSKHMGVPILLLTNKLDLKDRIAALEAGADYFLAKPFDTRELLASVCALLRRQSILNDVMTFGNTCLDLASSMLVCGNHRVRLSAREFEVMRCLMQSGERNLSKDSILSRVWGYESNAVENHVEVYVGFLRKKLKAIGSNIKIASLRRMGYHLEVES